MPFIRDAALDALLANVRDAVTTLYICNAEPTTYTEASSTFAVGNKATPTVNAPADRTGGGRQITVAAISDGTVTSDAATASHWALTSASVLLATNALASSQTVYTANGFTTAAFEIGVPDAVSA